MAMTVQNNLYFLQEDPDNFERAIAELIEISKSERSAQMILEGIYCESNRDKAFERFYQGLEFRTIITLLSRIKLSKKDPICEIGGGPGFLAWALHKSGFEDVSLLEPNGEWISGTGYLRSRSDSENISIENNLDDWYADPKHYAAVFTRNVIHHFKGLPFTIASVRQKIIPGGLWIAIREPFVETSSELYQLLREHPLCYRYSVYEFAYPIQYFIDSFRLAGFELISLIPSRYANNALSSFSEYEGNLKNRMFTKIVNRIWQLHPMITKSLYGFEKHFLRSIGLRRRLFLNPQLLIFRRIEVL